MFVGRVARGGLVILCAGGSGFLFDEDVGDEMIDDGRADGRIGSRPQHDARGREDFEGV